MSTSKRRLKLAYSAWPTGRHASAWRLPEAFNNGTVDPVYLADTARAVERGVFDYYFMGNAISSTPDAQGFWHNDVFKLEGFTVASYVAAITRNVGLVVTVNSSYQDPYDTARAIVSLDHLSNGRAGLNIVTGLEGVDGPAQNYGQIKHISGDEKYRRAREFISIINGLSDSWEDGYFLDDRSAGKFIDPSKAHTIDFKGDHFSVRGPLNLPRPPQGHIPVIHAGGSEASFQYGGEFADIRFSPFVSTEWNIEYYKKVKSYLQPFGRDPDTFFVIPGITFFVGGTDAEAHRKFREVQDLVVSQYVPTQVSALVGKDIASINSREKVVDVLDAGDLDKHQWLRTALAAFGDENVSLLDLFHYISNKGHLNQPPVVGSGKKIANWIAENFEARAFDGVKLFPPYARTPLDAFVDLVVPELQRLGIQKTSYEAETLRGHLGITRPANRFSEAAGLVAAE
ncbi:MULTISPECIES: NtaA/DmoA family FMN-dependent monooxygenase [Agrobacterium]|uniref:NtaA/DmoA family FMN-dependent monooxygenase n=1 Tax=Agrobacterium tumefaciens TaxID=358 RepID=A0AAE6BK98_AGRTU|nr:MULTISPECIES: NtaA/DmoA family FMN-dependent monooxygenase [Agrobacterium]QCL77322.1 NtaA/DmoA family FMN-dependent monooxygenase [Agrobacterium tumefaciens]QCL82829.1 NtaA/DmoA family FMN-dependent monooxygenase [Agrobacterium tumefaciens]WCK05820.1 NtaA/DmoA family FMN-dependent monooxygenase [Agrobacterium tumefaciens]CUX71836.1 putative monooxygenase [Agrobacterium sp. NCPPB 925]